MENFFSQQLTRGFTLIKLGIKYLYRYRRRYGFLIVALIFCFAVVTFITSIKDGMYDNVYHTAQSHYAGDIVVIGYDNGFERRPAQREYLNAYEVTAVLEAAAQSGIEPRHTVLRTLHNQNAVVHFNGVAVPLKYVVGCDWQSEAHLFQRMTFEEPPPAFAANISGSAADIAATIDDVDDGIILSVPTAEMLGAQVGDSIILEAETKWGQKNTGVFIVKAIVRDFSIFGYYKAYVSRLTLNRLILFEDEAASSIGLFFAGGQSSAGFKRVEQKRQALHAALAGQVQLGALVYDRDSFSRERRNLPDGNNVFLYTLPVYLSEISNLLSAMNIVSYFLFGMMLVIILVSASVTYRLILHERTRELGVMRAIGFYGADLRLVLWVEVLGVTFFSLACGFLLALIFNWGASLLSFSWFPSFEIFMKNGRLTAMYLPATMFANVASVFLLLVVVALFPSFHASRKNLVALLSGEPL
jgi:ABC-type antimicrobial peptide transport system permease subunit